MSAGGLLTIAYDRRRILALAVERPADAGGVGPFVDDPATLARRTARKSMLRRQAEDFRRREGAPG